MNLMLVYQIVNNIMLLVVVVMAKMLFDNLEVSHNKYLLLTAMGLAFDLVGTFSISYAKTVESALICERLSIVGRALFGIGFIAFMSIYYKSKYHLLVLTIWGVAIIGAFYHTIGIPGDTAYLSDVHMVYEHGIYMLRGVRGTVYHVYTFAVLFVGQWGLILVVKDFFRKRTTVNKIPIINDIFYFLVIIFQGLTFLYCHILVNDAPDFTPIARGIGTAIYAFLAFRYRIVNYESLASQKLMNDLGAGFMVCAKDYRVLYANDNARAHFKDLQNTTEEVYSREVVEAINKREFEFTRGGSTFRLNADRVYENGALRGYTILIYDISDIVALEKAHEESNRIREKMLRNISHELRTPLNSISGNIATFNYDKLNKDRVKETFDNIKVAITNMDDVLKDLLNAAAGEKETPETLVPYSVSTLVNNVTDMCNERVLKKKIKFMVKMGMAVPINAIGDDKKVRELLLSVLSNATRYTDSGFVSFNIGGKYLDKDTFEYLYEIVDINDNSDRAVWNERPRSVDETMDSDFSEGVSMSLSVAKRLVKSMDGDITISRLGKGTVINISFKSKIADNFSLSDLDFANTMEISFYGDMSAGFSELKRVCGNLGITVKEASNIQRLTLPADNKTAFLIFDYEKYGRRILQSERAEGFIKVPVISWGKMPSEIGKNWIFTYPPFSALTLMHLLEEEKRINESEETSKVFFTAPRARAMVVDDNGINLKMAAEMLSIFRIKADLCYSGYECLDLIKKGNHYDIILMDYMMENMDGVETTGKIRELEGPDNKTPIIAFTANSVEGAEKMYREGGMDDVLFKPAGVLSFAEILKKHLPETLIEGLGEADYHETTALNLPYIEGIDTEKALSYCGRNVDVFKDMLATFALEIDDKVRLLDTYYKERNYRNFSVESHGIKGVARALGMDELSEKMAELEKAGKEEDVYFIKNNLQSALEIYKAYKLRLSAFVELKEEGRNSRRKSGKTGEILSKIMDALDDFEMDRAEALMTELSPEDFSHSEKELFERLTESIEAIDYYASKDLVEQLLSGK